VGVESVPDPPGLGVVLVGQQPLLGSGGQTGLEFVPFAARGRLDPKRAESCRDRRVDDIRKVEAGIHGRARPHRGQFLLGRCPVPDLGAEQHPPAGIHQHAQCLEGLGDSAEGMVGAAVDDDVGLAGMVRRRALGEGGPVGEAPLAGVLATAGDVRAADVDTDSVCPGRGLQNPQEQFPPAAAVVGNGLRVTGGQFGGEPACALGGKRSVVGQSGIGAKPDGSVTAGIVHRH
jgi:hypothetical protein